VHLFVFFLLYALPFLLCVSFFFSSRRRHTRCYRDWSSDVCSSDLLRKCPGAAAGGPLRARLAAGPDSRLRDRHVLLPPAPAGFRSEERRVGKERRARGWLAR